MLQIETPYCAFKLLLVQFASKVYVHKHLRLYEQALQQPLDGHTPLEETLMQFCVFRVKDKADEEV